MEENVAFIKKEWVVIKKERVENVSDVVSEGDIVKVKVLDIDQRGKVKLSMKEVEKE